MKQSEKDKAEAKHGLPQKVFVRWEDVGPNDEPWLSTAEKESDLTEREEHFIGVYELKEVHAAKLVTTTRTVTKTVKA